MPNQAKIKTNPPKNATLIAPERNSVSGIIGVRVRACTPMNAARATAPSRNRPMMTGLV